MSNAAVRVWLGEWVAMDGCVCGSVTLCLVGTIQTTVFRAQEPKAPVTYCDHALSGVCRLSSVRQFTFSTSSLEPLDRF